jgi:hypothetical protein
MISGKVLTFVCVTIGLFVAGCIPQPPAVEIVSPENDATVSGTVAIQAEARSSAAVENVTYQIDSGDWVNMTLMSGNGQHGLWEGNWNTTVAQEGFHTITVMATNAIGLTDMDSVTVVVDNVPPTPGSAEVNLRAEVVSTATAELTIQARTGKV